MEELNNLYQEDITQKINFSQLESMQFDGKDEITVVVHGMGLPNAKWEKNLEKYFCNRKEQVEPVRWNIPEGDDEVPDNALASLEYYLSQAEKATSPKQNKVHEILFNKLVALKNAHPGKKINIISHSLGSLIAYRVLKDIEARNYEGVTINDFKLGKFITLGSPLPAFYEESEIGFDSKDIEFTNIWGTGDEFLFLSTAAVAGDAVLQLVSPDKGITQELLKMNAIYKYGAKINRIMCKINSEKLQNVRVAAKHGNMLFDPQIMLKIKDEYEE